MNKEYLIAKADLCKDLAIEQLSTEIARPALRISSV